MRRFSQKTAVLAAGLLLVGLLRFTAADGLLFPGPALAHEPAGRSWWSALRERVLSLFGEDEGPAQGTDASSRDESLPEVYREGEHEAGALRIINHVPVLILRGDPEAIAEQEAVLTGDGTANLVAAPQDFLATLAYPGGWEGLVVRGRNLWQFIPEDYRRELTSLAKKAGVSPDELLAVNALPDMYRDLACSSLVVLPERSATGTMLFGRNLDFFSPRQLYRYTIVKVYDQPGKRYRFASVGFPGFIGCLSGMNEMGLCLAVHEVRTTADRAPMFSPQGMPYAMLLRRIMEQCARVDEAIELLRSSPRTTLLNIVLCDRQKAAVAEITPRSVEVRYAEDGLLACTNHFRTPRLRTLMFSWRYERLMEAADLPRIDLPTLERKLDEVNLRFLTIQSMVFDPENLTLHLARGQPPVTKRPYHRVELSEWLRGNSPASGGEK
ncbi:C45 family autoproteolytic acyltransferase/hydolase [Thermogutta sp.]|uniref:C45 family autoproteolytic acyltransferase/hydolase n=1 Tax=Thermogutta sp. TaxID=1962930 RepID=UPI003C7B0761